MANSDTPELDEKNKQNQSLGKSTNSIVKNILSFLISLLLVSSRQYIKICCK
jgi:hypothetical protein